MRFSNQILPTYNRTIGTDPEIFVFGENGLIPAYEFLPAKTHAPIEDNAKYFWDGFQAEWNYTNGFNSIDELIRQVRKSFFELDKKAKKYNSTAKLTFKNVVEIDDETLRTAIEPYIQLGCKPSYNIYRKFGTKVDDGRDLKYRFAGGHMIFNFGRNKPDYETVIKTLDKILGIWSVGAAQLVDSPLRREYYGLAGEFRMPKFGRNYGVEYRTLSNFWLMNEEVMRISWVIARKVIELAQSRYGKMWVADEKSVQESINTCNVAAANKIFGDNLEMFRWMMGDDSLFEKAVYIQRKGVLVNAS